MYNHWKTIKVILNEVTRARIMCGGFTSQKSSYSQ